MKKVKIYESQISRAVRRGLMEKLFESNGVDETLIKVPADKMDAIKDKLPKDATVEITEDDDWMQHVSDEIDEDGTEGTFREYCISKGYRNGCSRGCMEEALRSRSTKLHYRAGLAHAFCSARK